MAGTLEKIKWYKKVYGTRKTCRYLKNKVLYGYMDDYPRWQCAIRIWPDRHCTHRR